jgi:translation initiation factor 1 (eIF-1/SUI1)
MKKSIVYINGIKASKKDLERLESDLKAGKQKAYGKTTKKGNIAYRTEF